VDSAASRRHSALLAVEELTVTYKNSARGVSRLSLSVAEGQIVAILGRNGAGKTSTLRGIAGFLRSDRVSVTGRVSFAGEELAGAAPGKCYKRGIVLVPERDKVFPALTVTEHLRLASQNAKTAAQPCAFEPLDRLRKSRAGLLSGGERQMLALEMAWRSEPRLLLVDEATLGLAPIVGKTVMDRLKRTAAERHTAVIIVEQDASAALRVSDHAYVIDRGRVLTSARSSEISAADVARRYLGTAV
jgi:ABC-type branched-subunit amino acid transport system ATPase component